MKSYVVVWEIEGETEEFRNLWHEVNADTLAEAQQQSYLGLLKDSEGIENEYRHKINWDKLKLVEAIELL